jgi:hypothetical protein
LALCRSPLKYGTHFVERDGEHLSRQRNAGGLLNGPRGPSKIGDALRKHASQIRWADIDAAFARFLVAWESTYETIFHTEAAGLVSHDEMLRRIFDYDRWLGNTRTALQALMVFLETEANPTFMQELWRQKRVPEVDIQKALSTRQKLTTRSRGEDLIKAVEESKTVLQAPQNDPPRQDLAKLASLCLNEILSELRRLGILGICGFCGKALFPTNPRKEVCSLELEGSDCSGKRRLKRAYRKRVHGGTR